MVLKKFLPLQEVTLNSLDGKAHEKVEITQSTMPDFTDVKGPTVKELKKKYVQAQNKKFYMTANDDDTYCNIRNEHVFKEPTENPIVESTQFGWDICGGKEYANNKCMFAKDASTYKKLCSLDVLGVEDRGKDDQL